MENVYSPSPGLERQTLREILDMLGPGKMLLPIWTKSCVKLPEYKVQPIARMKPLKRTFVPGPATRVQFHFHRGNSNNYILQRLADAYVQLQAGKNVEIFLHAIGKKFGTEDNRLTHELVEECLHLRPDVILKTMPEGIIILIEPQTSKVAYGFAIATPLLKNAESFNLIKAFRNRRKLQFELNADLVTDHMRLAQVKVREDGTPESSVKFKSFLDFQKNKAKGDGEGC
ncbi:MAG: hypothetical protein M1820_008134 [Bogoriella megaspora]|nr:MAG: hypothetical protein M1820_008134 [Bogoriella megaspora]